MIRPFAAFPALLAFLGLLFVAGPALAAADGLVMKKSAHSVEATLDRLQAALESKGLTIFARVDHGAGAESAGLDLAPTQLLIFGNPKLGTPLMQAGRSVAIDLPQKALAFEDADGQVWLAYNDPTYLARRHDLEGVDDVLAKIAGALETFSGKAVEGE